MIPHTTRRFVVLILLLLTPCLRADDSKLRGDFRGEFRGWTDEKLRGFMHELIDYVYEHHIVRDESRAVYGMTYEFFRDGKQVQEFGLDSMYDGLWFVVGMMTAHRAEPTAGHLHRVLTYQLPFYLNMLEHSDELFPRKLATNEDRTPPEAKQKGWVPRGWDDGMGYEKNTGHAFKPGYFTPSNHLAQDIADGLLNVWLTTRDPAIGRALRPLHEWRVSQKQNVVPVIFATGVTSGDEKLWQGVKIKPFEARALIGYRGMFEFGDEALQSYNDAGCWNYDMALTRKLLRGEAMDDYVRYAAANVYGIYRAMEIYHDDQPWPVGLHLFDIQGQPKFTPGSGTLNRYHSQSKVIYGARGIQFAAIAQAVLPLLKARPELWRKLHDEKFAAEPIVPIVDVATRPSGGEGVQMVSDDRSLHLYAGDRPVTVAIRHADVPGAKTTMVKIEAHAEAVIPYAAVSKSGSLNGVENGRYAVSIDGGPERVVYMLSDGRRIAAKLERDVLGTIETWHGVWKSYGYIASGIASLDPAAKHAFNLSDAGNYGHLVRTIALLLIERQGKTESEVIAGQTPAASIPAKPLPASVIEAQKKLRYE
jgi:hypothetical protein